MKYRIEPKYLIAPVIGGVLGTMISGNPAIGMGIFAVLLLPPLIRLYFQYAKENPGHLWFKRKLYGWGWVPVTWQGWLTTVVYIGFVMLFALTIDENSPTREIAFTFLIPVAILTATFIRILYKKGESPRWQWGKDQDDV